MSYEYVKRTYGHEPIVGNTVLHKVVRRGVVGSISWSARNAVTVQPSRPPAGQTIRAR